MAAFQCTINFASSLQPIFSTSHTSALDLLHFYDSKQRLEIEQLFSCLVVCVLLPGDVYELCGGHIWRYPFSHGIKNALRKKWHNLMFP